MKICFRCPHCVALLALILCPGFVLYASPEDNQEVKLVNRLETKIPEDLRHLLLQDPVVKFRVQVSPEGNIWDYVAFEASHYDLLDAAEEKLKDAKFEPARMEGKPAFGKITIYIWFFDPEQRAWKQGAFAAPMGRSVSEAVERRTYAISKSQFEYKECRANELDKPLAIDSSELVLYHAPDKPAPGGSVLVQYYVDHKGRVRLPQIIESDDEYLTLSVLKTLEKTTFVPPTRNGQPALVSVRQPFNFADP